MKENLTRAFGRYQRTFADFTTGQKMIAVLGTGALLLAGFMVFRWASTPSYAPLFSNLTSADASAVVDKLDAEGVPYKLSNGGATVMVPKDEVYSARIRLSGEGLPSSSDSGYSILDDQSLSTSTFQENTNFKRAMEAELSNTIEKINGVQTAVVHLALPEKQVFADKQDPATASVLIATKPGLTLDGEQVQAITHLVSSSIDGLDPKKVEVVDSKGRVLSLGDDTVAGAANTRAQQIADYEAEMRAKIQSLLDEMVGAGNSTVGVTANLDFDKTVTEKKTYVSNKDAEPLSESTSTEKYNGAAGPGSSLTGVVGPDGQMDSVGTANGNGDGQYENTKTTRDNAVDTTVEHRETAPGAVKNLNIGVALDAATARTVDAAQVQNLIAATAGIDVERGDQVNVTTVPFDRSAEEAVKKDIEAAAKAEAGAARMDMIRNAGLVLAVALVLLLAWLKGRKRAKARAEATSYVVEQLRQEALERATAQAEVETSAALMALEATEHSESDDMREELAALVERQPEDVAALLRGWLVERP